LQKNSKHSATIIILRKPPVFQYNAGVINLNSVCEINKQHSNYGYPFGADYLFI